jgi:hypothetical protein
VKATLRGRPRLTQVNRNQAKKIRKHPRTKFDEKYKAMLEARYEVKNKNK